MVRTLIKQRTTEESTTDDSHTRRSNRIQARTVLTVTTESDHLPCIKNITVAQNRKHVSEENNVGYRKPSATFSRNIAIIQEANSVSPAAIQTTVPQVTTIAQQSKRRGRPPKAPQTTTTTIQQPKKRGRPPKAASTTVLPAVDSELSSNSLAKQSSKREGHSVKKNIGLELKPKRRKGNTFTVPIPTIPQQIGQVYAIGSNDMSQCGVNGSDKKLSVIILLKKFKVVDISAGNLHSAALTADGKVVTWGCNDHGTLGRFTDNPSLAVAKAILEAGNYDIGEEDKPAYAEGLDEVNIVKVVCGGNATFAISDQGHLYMTGTFKGKDGILGFSYDNHIEQPIFIRYMPFKNLTIVDVAAGEDHALALTSEGDVYAWGNGEAHRLGRKFSERRSLKPFNLGLKHIVRLYAGSYHNFAIDKNGQAWVFGYNNMGQCGLGASKQAIIPPERHSFFNEIYQKVEEFAAGQHHTLARMQDGRIYSFGRSDYGQLGLGDDVLKMNSKENKARVVTPTIIPRLVSVKLVETGDNFSMAVDDANNIYTWGFGEYPVFGNGKYENDVTSPLKMLDLDELEGKEIIRISCGSAHGLFLVA